jgi:hypothetical protein
MPLPDTRSWPRNPAWRAGLALILRRMSEADLPEAARKTADDLATLALDMLMDEAGKARSGPNLFFHPGCEVEEASSGCPCLCHNGVFAIWAGVSSF